MRRAAKVDDNQAKIVAALRKRGHLVQSLASVGNGVPDLLVGVDPTQRPVPGRTYTLSGPRTFVLLEVKDGRQPRNKRALTEAERTWHAAYKGWPVAVVECAEDAVRFVEGL